VGCRYRLDAFGRLALWLPEAVLSLLAAFVAIIQLLPDQLTEQIARPKSKTVSN
jgi:hypothetical protein